MELRRRGAVEERVFAETRLRRGVYGQRYDNGQRHDGLATQRLEYPSGELTKGPETLWDAPGMQRIKVPFGGITPDQLDVIAELAEEYSDGILHVTTRQDIQLHFVHIDDTPTLIRRLAAVGITTREACGNSVRNVTACPLAGVCHTEAFDVTPYAAALFRFLLGHPDCQDFGRKFKIAFSGCADEACGLVTMHDLGGIARSSVVDGVERRAFEIYVGGGLGAVPHQAKLLYEFLPDEELLPDGPGDRPRVRPPRREEEPQPRAPQVPGRQARHRRVPPPGRRGAGDPAPRRPLDRVPAAHRRLRRVARARGRAGLEQRRGPARRLRRVGAHQRLPPAPARLRRRHRHLPLGDITLRPDRARSPTSPAATSGDTVPHDRRAEHRAALGRRGRPAGPLRRPRRRSASPSPGAGTIVDVTACPGTDTCKLGIASSRGLAGELRTRLGAQASSSSTRPSATCASRSAAASTPAASTTSPTSASTATAARSAAYTVPHFQVDARRAVARERRLVRPGDRRGPVEAHPRGRRRHHDPLRRRARRRARPSRPSRPRSARRS